jgi:hypothetical protein
MESAYSQAIEMKMIILGSWTNGAMQGPRPEKSRQLLELPGEK